MSYYRNIKGRSPITRYTDTIMPRNNSNRKNQHKMDKSGNDSQTSDSSKDDSTTFEYSLNTTVQSTEESRDFTPNTSRLQSDFRDLSSSGGKSTSTPIFRGDNSAIKHRFQSKSENNTPVKVEQQHSDSNSVNDSGYHFQITSILGVCLVILVFVLFMGQSDSTVDTNEFLKQKLEVLIDNTKPQFPLQDETVWDDFIVGITDVISLNRQAVFLLIYSNGTNMVHKLAKTVAVIASQIIKSDNTMPVEITYRDLNVDPYLQDHGKLITKCRSELENHGALIVHDLHLVKGSVARAFHTICDQYVPLVQQSVIIFTMNVDDIRGKPAEIGENRLNQVWSEELDPDILTPLVTRLTGNVIKIV